MRWNNLEQHNFKLTDRAAGLEAARWLVYRAVWAYDRAVRDAKLRASTARLFATEAAQRIVDQALQIDGGSGLIAGSMMERLGREVSSLLG